MAKRGAMRLYKSYVFRDKDPIIDAMRTAFEDAGGSYAHISAKTNVSRSTMAASSRAVSRCLLVTSAMLAPLPGSSGLT